MLAEVLSSDWRYRIFVGGAVAAGAPGRPTSVLNTFICLGLEDGPVYSADPTQGTVMITDGPYVETKDFWAGSPWSTWPMTRPPRCGRAR